MEPVTKPKPKRNGEALRRAEIATIKIAIKELGMDDDTYRAMLKDKTGKTSAADLNWQQRKIVIDHLTHCGFKVRSTKAARPAPAGKKQTPSRALDVSAEGQKIRALWIFLHDLGVVRDPSEAALAAYVKRLTGVDALQWLDGDQTYTVIETLKKWAMRFLPKIVDELVQSLREQLLAKTLTLSQEQIDTINWALAGLRKSSSYDTYFTIWETLNRVVASKDQTQGGA